MRYPISFLAAAIPFTCSKICTMSAPTTGFKLKNYVTCQHTTNQPLLTEDMSVFRPTRHSTSPPHVWLTFQYPYAFCGLLSLAPDVHTPFFVESAHLYELPSRGKRDKCSLQRIRVPILITHILSVAILFKCVVAGWVRGQGRQCCRVLRFSFHCKNSIYPAHFHHKTTAAVDWLTNILMLLDTIKALRPRAYRDERVVMPPQ